MTGGDSDKGDHPAGVEQFRNLPVSRLNSKYLYSNQTSHAWVFGAIAELLDNAMDPDCLASQVMIQLTEVQEKAVLVIMDNGNGMTPEALYKMLSFGYSEKTQEVIQGRRSIGHYGNGFKSGSMRIGKDALVLTKCGDTQSVGLLSRTFLETIEAEEVYLPLLTWDHEGKLQNEDDKTVREGLEAISKYSIFDSEEDLLSEFEAIKETGTMIIISNLKKLGDENDADSPLELCVDPEEADIKISSYSPDGKSKFQQLRVGQGSNVDIPLDYSLRAYVSVLYKVPRMQIFLMGKKVKCKRASQQLSERMHDTYKPYSAGGQPADILIGFSEPEDLYGMMMYHNNRLIKPYVRVGCQMEANAKGVGVLGIIDANFLTPMHNKQDFADTKEYRGLINKLSQNLNMFWWAKVEKPAAEEKDREEQQKKKRRRKQPDVNWVQCGYPPCAKWRILPKGTDMTPFNDENFHWVCSMHPNPKIADSNHEYPEDTWDIDVVQGEEAAAKRREWQAEKRQKKAEEVAKKDAQVLQLAQEGLLQHIQFEGVNQPVNAGPEPPREVQVQQPSQPPTSGAPEPPREVQVQQPSQPPTPGAPEPPREVQVQQPLASPDALECKNDSDSDTISEDHAAEIRQPPVTQKEGTAVALKGGPPSPDHNAKSCPHYHAKSRPHYQQAPPCRISLRRYSKLEFTMAGLFTNLGTN
ncbi:MORC family CW-type zinc finger protein [Chloropicon primus]|uniref:CW-type domain-containing protein n=1 Tax=Chloropicon primus TaxID=1764295 RepID=A0A5B8MGY4_9CHLO|nr:hypothetical protein A3770_02p11300 [Chloropicon primus]UPQ97821.1 MORC family CW-type zinc finger protein [Chloropicon primus]|eukprot:QDZ18612.1 hypothetical protein A3770_02p11300 [Chloropicon primus]